MFFCPSKDIGTENEKWSEMKLKETDSLCLREETEVPEPDCSRLSDTPISFSFTMEVEESEGLKRFLEGMRKFDKGHRHYLRKTLTESDRKRAGKMKRKLSKIRLTRKGR